MPYVNAAKHLMLDELKGVALYASLHSGDPGTTGANELSGGSPAYARQLVAWGTAASGAVSITGTETFDVPAGTVSHFGLRSAVTGGTFYGGAALSATEVFAAQGQYVLNALAANLNS